MSRTIRQRLVAGVGAAIVLAGLPLFALADTEINARGWSHEHVYRYWQGQVGLAGRYAIDPQQQADTLFQVARRCGAL